MFGVMHVSLIGVRLERNTFASGHSRWTQGTGYRKASADSGRNLLGKFFPVGSTQGVSRFGWVGKEAAFHEYRGDTCFSQNIVTTASHSTIRRRRATCDEIMDS